MVSNKLNLEDALKEVEIICKRKDSDEKQTLKMKLLFLEGAKRQTEDALKEILADKKFIEGELKKIDKKTIDINKKLMEY